METRETPLTCEIKDGQIVIRVGVETLKWATEHAEENNPFDNRVLGFRRLWRITNPDKFAEDVCIELWREEEDGRTLVTKMIDQAASSAINKGSSWVEKDGRLYVND